MPIVQVLLGISGIVTGETVISLEYVIVMSTIVAAVVTPSTDPITQLFLTGALLALYLGGSSFVILLEKRMSLTE